MLHYLRIRSDALTREGFDFDALQAEVTDTAESELLLRRFASILR